MGATASIADRVDIQTFEKLAGVRFSKSVFDHYCDANGTISKEKLLELDLLSDVYIAHAYGVDKLGRNIHDRAVRISNFLRRKGLITRYSLDTKASNPSDYTFKLVDHASLVVVCLNKLYVDKNEFGGHDEFSKFEFEYISTLKHSSHIIVVVMERRMRDRSAWTSAFSSVLAECTVVDASGDADFDESNAELLEAVMKVIHPITSQVQGTPSATNETSSVVTGELSPMTVETPQGHTENFNNIGSPQESSPTSPEKDSGKSSSKPKRRSSVASAEGRRESLRAKLTVAAKVPSKDLASLSLEETIALFCSLKLSWCEEAIRANNITGEVLAAIESEDKFQELGLQLKAVRSCALFGDLQYFVVAGVPSNLLNQAPRTIRTISECLVALDQATQFYNDEDMVKIALESIPNVISDDAPKQRAFGLADDVLSNLVALLRRCDKSASLTEHGLVAIKVLCCLGDDTTMTCVENAKEFGRVGACELIVNALTMHRSSVRIMKAAFRAIQSLILEEANLNKLIEANLCDVLVPALVSYRMDAIVTEECCRVVWNLALIPRSRELLSAAGACEVLTDTLKQHVLVSSVVEPVCAAVFSMAVDEVNAVKFVRGGVAESVATAMKAYHYHATITMLCCGIIWYLSVVGENRGRLLAAGVGQNLVLAVQDFEEDTDIALYFCNSIRYLAEDLKAAADLGALGACETVLQALDAFGELPDVAQNGCIALWRLAEASDNLTILKKEGAVKAVVKCIENLLVHSDVVKYALMAIRKLTAAGVSSDELKKLRLLPLVASAVVAHGNLVHEIAVEGSAVIAAIISGVSTEEKLSCSIHTVMIDTLRSHSSKAVVLVEVFHAIAEIMKDKELAAKLIKTEECARIVDAAVKFVNVPDVMYSACKALVVFGDDPRSREIMIAIGTKDMLNSVFQNMNMTREAVTAARELMDKFPED